MNDLGIVIIGRNEGERLRRCLSSVKAQGVPVVYVDSGSTDGSVDLARSFGVEVEELGSDRPFTVARGRNAGVARLLSLHPGIRHVQFLDGDCELVGGWLSLARNEMERRADVAAVGGRRREREPHASCYARLFDLEWDRPTGDVLSCGGDALVRLDAFRQVEGYNATLIGGTDPDFCYRLRRCGWRIVQLAAEMSVHDGAVHEFGPWWKRTVRTGHAYAEIGCLHFGGSDWSNIRAVASALVWGGATVFVLLASIIMGLWNPAWFVLTAVVLLGYLAILASIFVGRYRRGNVSPRDAALYAVFCLLGKIPQTLGIFRFGWRRLLRRGTKRIEYKATE